jgi:hypothetical protein
MPPIPDALAEARQLLAACGWQVESQINTTKTEYIVIDREGVRRRSFVPPQRLLDYARGVFDSTEFGVE